MGEDELEELIGFARELADAARAPQRREFRSAQLRGVDKPDFTAVTEADREAEALMRAMIRKRYPDHGMEGEEFGAERADAEWLWRLDPIDGTNAFIAGKPTFCTLIALCLEGVPVMGLIDQAITEERWIGAKGRPATRDGEPARVRACEELGAAIMAATTPAMFKKPAEQAAFAKVAERVRFTTWGGDAYNYALLASGHIDLVVEADLALHDAAALIPVIEGAGGVVTDWRGEPFSSASSGRIVAAGDHAAHEAALALLDLH